LWSGKRGKQSFMGERILDNFDFLSSWKEKRVSQASIDIS